MAPHLVFKVFQLVLDAFALLGLSGFVFGILGDDAVLQVRRLVDIALIAVHREIVVGTDDGGIVDARAHQ